MRALEPDELKQRMIRRAVDPLPPQRVADDLVDAPLAHAFFARDLPIGPAEAQPREDALRAGRASVSASIFAISVTLSTAIRGFLPKLCTARIQENGTENFYFLLKSRVRLPFSPVCQRLLPVFL